jgi:hypothetical protein
MAIDVEEWYDEDGDLNLTISWDENDPVESQFNDWTDEDFLTAITNACDEREQLSVGRKILPDEDFGMYSTPDT